MIYTVIMKINVKKLKLEMGRAGVPNNKDLAAALGMKRQSIDYILLKQSTTFKTLNRIADYLCLDAKDLLS